MRAQAYDNPNYHPDRTYNGPGEAIANLYLSENTEHARLWLPQNQLEWQSIDLLRPDIARQTMAERDIKLDWRSKHRMAHSAFILCDLDTETTERFDFTSLRRNQTVIVGRRPNLRYSALSSDYVAQQHMMIRAGDDGWLNLNTTLAGDDSPIGLEVVDSARQAAIKFPSGTERYDYAKPIEPDPDLEKVRLRHVVALAGAAQLGLFLRNSGRR
ncbi:MAG TPA: hypothetical protein VFG56_01090 [Candidatus Saccharimonadales bacterium]|nr:hypothetical protein [Candidatus Saccharimonadales bacterium]